MSKETDMQLESLYSQYQAAIMSGIEEDILMLESYIIACVAMEN